MSGFTGGAGFLLRRTGPIERVNILFHLMETHDASIPLWKIILAASSS